MAAPTVTALGLAAVSGCPGTLDCVTYPINQSIRTSQQWEEEIVKDVNGFDACWLLRNEHATGDIGIAFLGDTHAHAILPMTATAGPASGAAGQASVSGLGQPFLKMGATIFLSGFDFSAMNGTWMVLTGSDFDAQNDKSSKGTLKLRKYANATQNTAQYTLVTAGG